MISVSHLFRYPVKGMSPEPMTAVALTEGRALPGDRVFAFARPGGAVDPAAPRWARKTNFLCLVLDEALASVRTEFDAGTRRLSVWREGARLLDAPVDSGDGRAALERLVFDLMGDTLPAAPRFVAAADGEFMDSADRATVSLINLASVRDMELRFGQSLDLRRFRSNIYVEGGTPWLEHDWIGGTLAIGSAKLRVDRRNPRCAATNVDPDRGVRDRDIPRKMMEAYGHRDLGLNLIVSASGRIAVGDAVAVAAV